MDHTFIRGSADQLPNCDPDVDPAHRAGDRHHLEAAVEGVLAAIRNARGQLDDLDGVLVEGLARVRSGANLGEALDLVPPVRERKATDGTFGDLFEARLHLRQSVIYAALEDGMTIDVIASKLQVSADVICALAAKTPLRHGGLHDGCSPVEREDPVEGCRPSGIRGGR
jgi:hypothetical protein